MTLRGIDETWIGATPADWLCSRIRNIAVLSPGYSKTPPQADEECTVVPMERLSESGGLDDSIALAFDDISTGLTLFEAGDVLFAKITPCMENGKGAYVENLPTRYAFGSTEFHVLRPLHWCSGRFLYYCTYNPVYRAYAAENMVGAAGQKRVASRFVKDTRLYLPSKSDQKRIAAYLDASCAAIDAAIDTKRKQIETLDIVREAEVMRIITKGLDGAPLKSIDQDWITEIPENWMAVRVKRLLVRLDYGISISTEQEGSHQVLKMGNIQAGKIVFSNIEYIDDVPEELLLMRDDILYNRTNSPDQVGKAAIFKKSITDAVTFASYLVRLRVNHRVSADFLNYVLNCEGFLGFARKLAIPSVQQSNLNSTRYGRMLVPLPPISEQLKIVEKLSTLEKQVLNIKQTLEKQIDVLTAYRKSLIHECVTGQRRITESDLEQVQAHGG